MILVCLSFLLSTFLFSQEIIISEICPSNANVYEIGDPDEPETPDWIEFRNMSATIVDLSTYAISKNPNPATAFTLPNISVKSGDYIVLTSNEESFTSGMFIPFSLSASGETVYLFKNGEIKDSIKFKDMQVDKSIGRHISDYVSPYYFEMPTPGKANTGTPLEPKTLDPPIFSNETGAYGFSFDLTLHTTEKDADIYYTTDGTVPTSRSKRYSSPIKISSNTNIRAVTYKQKHIASDIETSSYIFHLRDLNVPIVSISMDEKDLFDYYTGIYVLGPNAESEHPNFGANFWQDWEKPCHVDLINSDGYLEMSYDLGVKIAGNYSRANDQKSLKFYARKKYNSPAIEYQIFKDKPLYEFQSFIIRNAGNDFNYSHMRDALTSSLVQNMGVSRSAFQPAIAYVNGEYFGMFNLREKINKHYVSLNYNVPLEHLSLINANGWGNDLVWGDATSYHELTNFIESNDISIPSNYEHVKQELDLQDFMKYFFIEMYVVNEDWPGNNIKSWKDERGGKWRYILWDTDFGFGIWDLEEKVNKNMFEHCLLNDPSVDWPNPQWSTLFLRRFVKNEEFNQQFMNHTADRLNTTFSSDSINYLIDSISYLRDGELNAHGEKWRHDWWQDSWGPQGNRMRDEVEIMRKFANRRGDIMRRHFEEFYKTGGSYNLTLNISKSGAGKIHLNTIDVTRFPFNGQYFKNNTIELTAIPAPGYEFLRWEGTINSTEKTITVTRDKATILTAVFGYNADIHPKVFFTEIHYHPKDSLSGGTWVEIYNANSTPQDISNWTLKNNQSYNSFTISSGTVIPPRSYVVFSTDTAALKKVHNLSKDSYIGNVPFDFSNQIDVARLYNAEGYLIDKMAYSDDYPWAKKPDGNGYSLALISITADRKKAENWRPITVLGTPAAANAPVILTPNRNSIVINEINYNSHENINSGDWIELHNTSSLEIDISTWVVKDKKWSNLFVIPEGTIIEPNGFVVFAQNAERFAAIYPDVDFIDYNIGLNSYSDAVRLYDQYEYLIDSVAYTVLNPWPTNANGTGYTLSLIDPKSDNSKPQSWQRSKDIGGTPGAANVGTDIEEVPQMTATYCYPNPTLGIVKVEVNNLVLVEVYSAVGSKVLESTEQTIDLSLMPKGVYTFVITTDDEEITEMVVKY